ncbi:MAG: transposase [Bacteroidota bacterium]
MILYTYHKRTKTKKDWAYFIKELADNHYKDAIKIRLVVDNLNTHSPSALYEVFQSQQAKRLWDQFEFIYTPKHGSWLNMAEIELNVLNRKCLGRRIDNIEMVKEQVQAWCKSRNNKNAKINWQFTTSDARVKLRTLYPKIET